LILFAGQQPFQMLPEKIFRGVFGDNSGLQKHGGNLRLAIRFECAVSSVVEHYLDTVGVTGSNPVSRTIFI
jgi:hypothetical protein